MMARALKNVYARSAQAVAQILKSIGYGATSVARALKDLFHVSIRKPLQS